MDAISEIIQTFSTDDTREFRVFINRQKRKKHRKDLELFHLLQKQPKIKPNEAVANLYNDGNRLHYVCEYLRICYDYLLWVLMLDYVMILLTILILLNYLEL